VSALSSSCSSLTQRRSGRITSQPARYDEEQLSLQLQQEDELELCRALQHSLEDDVNDSTDEDIPPIELDSKEEEEHKEQPIVQESKGWSDVASTIVVPPFTSFSGLARGNRITHSPLSFFQLMLPLSLVHHIAVSSSNYAHSKHRHNGWCTTAAELYCFIAVQICMGIARLPQAHMYWNHTHHHPFVSSIMSRDRFIELQRYFYVTTPEQQQRCAGPLKKILWFIQQVQHIFSSSYLPIQTLIVDEAMVGFKGRSGMKQYMAQKPTKWGYKIWCLVSNNYLLQFEIYEGKGSSMEENVGSNVVLRLTQPYQYKNHILYMDRYFTSPFLLNELLKVDIRACGTVRKDRVGLPPTYKYIEKELPKGKLKYWQQEELGALVWKDRRAVYMITTHRSPDAITYLSCKGNTEQKAIPTAALDYNKYKGGVDTVDQMRESYSIGRKSKKWWPNIVWWLIDMCIINAYSLYNSQQQVKIRQLEFREQLMQELVERYGQERSCRGRPPSIPRIHPQPGHWPHHTTEDHDCAYCSDEPECRRRSRFQCKLCRVHLCIDPCFELYHTQH
jgi:hypothetical protein